MISRSISVTLVKPEGILMRDSLRLKSGWIRIGKNKER